VLHAVFSAALTVLEVGPSSLTAARQALVAH
jgi:hypothetical protein